MADEDDDADGAVAEAEEALEPKNETNRFAAEAPPMLFDWWAMNEDGDDVLLSAGSPSVFRRFGVTKMSALPPLGAACLEGVCW